MCVGPQLGYRLWNDTEAEELVSQAFPGLLRTFQRMLPIQRADLFRYVRNALTRAGIYFFLPVFCSGFSTIDQLGSA